MTTDILNLQKMQPREDVTVMAASTYSTNCKNSSGISLFIC